MDVGMRESMLKIDNFEVQQNAAFENTGVISVESQSIQLGYVKQGKTNKDKTKRQDK